MATIGFATSSRIDHTLETHRAGVRQQRRKLVWHGSSSRSESPLSFLRHRDRQPELMDQPGLSEQEHCAALTGLRRVNLFSSGVGRIWSALRSLAASQAKPNRLRVLDVACGGGDVAVRLAMRARQSGVPLEIDGCDISATALKIAQAASRRVGLERMKFFSLNALDEPLPQGYDVIMCSLFLHHLENDEARQLMNAMASAARRAILIDDLQRTRWGYVLCWAGCRILTCSPIVHVDGPLSVRAAFTIPEVHALAIECGLHGVEIERHWPQRFLLSWERS